ncbi:FAD-dependent monooxygenase [Thiomicrorhabdus sp. zzn3]|uniref:FAD-dependent monooxygenase n=1 Tax=Thiomicrorhabdus sp. zzn3 TaxID=3039775 RepID=UPI002436F3E4|nr:FAD-dependent monooxygenase [Thiomicrorhabdus sp. zzn3]MDG6777755.1 FAD-dependent monooxygenase [Thiomicrorhabdus sp. zzn3]
MNEAESKSTRLETDVVISGGGPVGLMLALGLAQNGYQVVVAERFAHDETADTQSQTQKSSFDGRVLALSFGSAQVLQKLRLWQDLRPFLTDILHVHVSQKGYLGLTKLHAAESGVPALGYSVQSSDLGRVLWQHVQKQAGITVLCPATLLEFEENAQGVVAKIQSGQQQTDIVEVQARLMVGADGTDSQVRKQLKLPIEEKSYDAFGVIAQIETRDAPDGWSFERFTEEGPVALLPMQGHFHKAVLVCPQEQLEQVMSLDDAGFIELFASKMGERLGGFVSVSPRMAYPLKESYVPQMVQGRAVLMGNASHTQHPVAAQGLNLGIRDIDDFIEALAKAGLDQQKLCDPGKSELLQNYAQKRREDHARVMNLTDGLIQVFQHRSPIVGHLRGVGLMAMQAMPKLRRRFARFAMGGRQA